MSARVTVVDYGLGNLFSVSQALRYCGAEVQVSNAIEEIVRADRLVLPGVGAFADGMRNLAAAGLDEAVRRYVEAERPFLGICLGMQMMFEHSEEFGNHAGLSLLPGSVVAIPPTGADGRPHKIPHIGWNALRTPDGAADWKTPLLEGIAAESYVYFVHSFMAAPDNPAHRLADTHYDGRAVAAVVGRGNLLGCQFHPEKSATVGLTILGNFLRL